MDITSSFIMRFQFPLSTNFHLFKQVNARFIFVQLILEEIGIGNVCVMLMLEDCLVVFNSLSQFLETIGNYNTLALIPVGD